MIWLLVLALLPDPETAARQHFEKAERAYRVGNYDVAVDEYQAAYDAKPAPELLYDLAQALRKRFAVAGATADLRRGIEVFRAYLREDPQTPKRETVERLLTDMRATLADIEARKEAQPAPQPVQPVQTQLQPQPEPQPIIIQQPPPPTPPEEEPPVYKKWWFWTLIGGAVVAGTVTAVAVSSGGTNLHGPTIDLSH